MSGWIAFEAARWDGPPSVCVRCSVSGRVSLLPGEPDASGGTDARRVWRCAACRTQFSVLTGTLLERSRVPLPTWLAVLADLTVALVPVRELARRHRITPATARLLRGRLLAADVRVGDAPDAALRRVLRLAPSEVERVRRAVPGRRDPREGPSASYA